MNEFFNEKIVHHIVSLRAYIIERNLRKDEITLSQISHSSSLGNKNFLRAQLNLT